MERKNLEYHGILSILTSYILGYVYFRIMFFWNDIFESEMIRNIGLLGFAIGLLVWVEYVCRGRERKKEVYFWYGCTVLILIAFVLGEGPLLGSDTGGLVGLFVYFMLHVIVVYGIMVRGQWLICERTSGYFLLDLVYGMVLLPFSNLFLRGQMVYAGLKKVLSTRIEKKSMLVSGGVIVGSILFLTYAISLLSKADENFGKIFSDLKLSFTVSDFIIGNLIVFLFSIPVGMYLFGLVVGGIVNQVKMYDREKIEEFGEKCHVASVNLLTIVLVLFCCIYIMYLWLQGGYFFGAFWGNLPKEFTFAEYARQGFFELCRIIGLNVLLFWIVVKISQVDIYQAKVLRSVLFLFHGLGFLFVVTAFSKVILYIGAYGLTSMRIMSLWVIIILLAAVSLSIGYMFGMKEVARKWIYFMVGTFTIVCYYMEGCYSFMFW